MDVNGLAFRGLTTVVGSTKFWALQERNGLIQKYVIYIYIWEFPKLGVPFWGSF